MKLSILTLSALLASAVHLNAQSNAQSPKPAKKTSQSGAKTKQRAKPKKEATVAKDSVKPINKDPDHYYCPPCGMG